MQIHVDAKLRAIRAGIEAYAPALHLADHGIDRDEAIARLRRGVTAWCEGLQRQGESELTWALKRHHVRFESDAGPLTVEIVTRPDA